MTEEQKPEERQEPEKEIEYIELEKAFPEINKTSPEKEQKDEFDYRYADLDKRIELFKGEMLGRFNQLLNDFIKMREATDKDYINNQIDEIQHSITFKLGGFIVVNTKKLRKV